MVWGFFLFFLGGGGLDDLNIMIYIALLISTELQSRGCEVQ